ncbi:MAG: alpha-amylase family glycosyl hydrolase [Flavobacteriaceae bacterium]|nr:alpha-amylase family glycosyl hydrolase [Flavobacteriaceae bacterium]
MKILVLVLMLFSSLTMQSQKIKRVEPPYWWVGMQHQKVQLLIYGDKIADHTVAIDDKEIKISSVEKTNNPNYLFLSLDFTEVKQARDFKIVFSKNGEENIIYPYSLKSRELMSAQRQGFKSSDVIYLITPDRFANGDTANDINKGLNEKTIDRKNDYARHGGDIKGITDHLNYIGDMGFTAIWPSPMLKNDMPGQSYHGYAITDLYEVDPRFGTLEEYKTLSKEAKNMGIKLIMDMVANHIGSEHWWMKDLPSEDWVNFQKEYLRDSLVVTNHRRTTNQDPYASEKRQKIDE